MEAINRMDDSSYKKLFYILGIVIFTAMILYFGRSLFVPLSFAVFISLVLQPYCIRLEKSGLGRVVPILIGILVVMFFFLLIMFLLFQQFSQFIQEWPVVKLKLDGLLGSIKSFLVLSLGFSDDQVNNWFADMKNSSMMNSLQTIQSAIQMLMVNLVMLVLIPVYVFLILYYRNQLVLVLYNLFPERMQKKVTEVIVLSIQTYHNFIKGMLVVYLLVGILNSTGLLILGVPHAVLFGFLTAIMTFIPYLGIVVASLLPITFAWITYDSVWYPIGVIAIFTFVQYLEANIIFPWAVGTRLQLNTLMTLIVIILGGIIWGGAGMILFIPFAAILKLVADRMEGWDNLSRLLGK